MTDEQRPRKTPLWLLLCRFSEPAKDLVATTLAWMCKEQDIAFDVYYAAYRGGGLFSHHGSTLRGGRHQELVAEALTRHSATVVRLGDVSVFSSLVHCGADRVIDLPDGMSIADMYKLCADVLGAPFPSAAVAVQTADMPEALGHGIAQYAFPEAVARRAVAVPLELEEAHIKHLAELGVGSVSPVAKADAPVAHWRNAGIAVDTADLLRPDDDYTSLTFRIADRYLEQASGIDMCEPLLASSWLPFCVRENRLQVTGEQMASVTARLAPMVSERGARVVYGRWGGGAIGGATSDQDLFPLFEKTVAFQVIEPARPVLSVLSMQPTPLAQPATGPFELEPSDDQLRAWANKGRILVTLITHSGELSHDDAISNTIDLSAATGVKLGIGVHAQRYAFNPACMEQAHVPVDEGGALGVCEPVLHSSGVGIVAESLAAPDRLAEMMADARASIAGMAGERFAPRGVYCYLDAAPHAWRKRPESLWRAIADAGFEYVVSSVDQGDTTILYRDGDFVVLNLCGVSKYPYSPFMRVDRLNHLVDAERRLERSPAPSWMIGVLDIPLYGYSTYLTLGDPSRGLRLGDFMTYIQNRGESGRLISATPHTIARYARMLDDLNAETTAADVNVSTA